MPWAWEINNWYTDHLAKCWLDRVRAVGNKRCTVQCQEEANLVGTFWYFMVLYGTWNIWSYVGWPALGSLKYEVHSAVWGRSQSWNFFLPFFYPFFYPSFYPFSLIFYPFFYTIWTMKYEVQCAVSGGSQSWNLWHRCWINCQWLFRKRSQNLEVMQLLREMQPPSNQNKWQHLQYPFSRPYISSRFPWCVFCICLLRLEINIKYDKFSWGGQSAKTHLSQMITRNEKNLTRYQFYIELWKWSTRTSGTS